VGGEIFRTRPDRPWGHPASYTMGTVSFPEAKRPGSGVNHPPPSSVEVKEKVELYHYSSMWALVSCFRANITFTLLCLMVSVLTLINLSPNIFQPAAPFFSRNVIAFRKVFRLRPLVLLVRATCRWR
jgi:hypothetical protein